MMFSVMITAPSTMIPKSIAPSEERERDRQGHDERRADVVEKQREQDDDEPRAFDEIPQHRGDRRLHQPVAAVVGTHLDPGRQHLLDLGDLGLHALDDVAGVLAAPHQHDALDEVVVVVAAEPAEP
jgi:hypothetical protein